MDVEVHADPHRPTPEVIERIAEFFRRYTYKPGVRAIVGYMPEAHVLTLHLQAPALNADDWDRDVLRNAEVVSPASMPLVGLMFSTGALDTERLKWMFSSAIRHLEMHEIDEWLRFDGKHVKAPHPPKGAYVG